MGVVNRKRSWTASRTRPLHGDRIGDRSGGAEAMRGRGDRRIPPENDVTMVFRLPRVEVVDRLEFLLHATRGRRVFDLGFVDKGLMTAKRSAGTWLHALLADSARELVGLDVNEEGVRLARALGFDAAVADCQDRRSLTSLRLEPADVVLGGELIEHLDRPGSFLEAVKVLLRKDGELILTTPNAFALANFLAALIGREVINVDHVAWHSWRTLESLLARHGWRIQKLMYYARQPLTSLPGSSWRHRAKIAGHNAFRRATSPLYAIWPSLADGMIIVAVPGTD